MEKSGDGAAYISDDDDEEDDGGGGDVGFAHAHAATSTLYRYRNIYKYIFLGSSPSSTQFSAYNGLHSEHTHTLAANSSQQRAAPGLLRRTNLPETGDVFGLCEHLESLAHPRCDD